MDLCEVGNDTDLVLDGYNEDGVRYEGKALFFYS